MAKEHQFLLRLDDDGKAMLAALGAHYQQPLSVVLRRLIESKYATVVARGARQKRTTK